MIQFSQLICDQINRVEARRQADQVRAYTRRLWRRRLVGLAVALMLTLPMGAGLAQSGDTAGDEWQGPRQDAPKVYISPCHIGCSKDTSFWGQVDCWLLYIGDMVCESALRIFGG